MKMSGPQTDHYDQSLRIETPNFINAMILHVLDPKMREHNKKKVRGREKAIGKIR